MEETVCDAYSNLGEIPMEDYLYSGDYGEFNSDHQLDAYVYCLALRCGELYCSGIGL